MPPRRAPQLAPAERKKQLLACAIQAFAKEGFGNAGHAQVAKIAGVAVPTVFAYFPTRTALIEEVVQEIERLMIDILKQDIGRSDLSAYEKMHNILLAYVEAIDKQPDIVKVFLSWSTAFQDDVSPLFRAYQKRAIKILGGIVKDGQKHGEFGKEVDPTDAALVVLGSAGIIAQLKFWKYKSARITHYLSNLIRGALHLRPIT